MSYRASQHRFLLILITLSLVRGLLYAVLVPLWQAPDEQAHFEYAALIAEQRRLPDEKAVSPRLRREIVAAMSEQNWNRFMGWKVDGGDVLPGTTPDIPGPAELRHPPLYYLAGAILLWPLRHQEISVQLYLLRFYSVLLSTLTLGIVYATARELFPNRWRLQMAAPLLLLFIPAHTFLSATVNNDCLAELLLSAQFLLWSRVFRRGLTWRRALSIAALLGLGLWTKGTTAIGIPLAGVALTIHALPKAAPLFQKFPWGRVLIPISGVALLVLVGAPAINPHNAQGWNKTGIWESQTDNYVYKGRHAIRVPPQSSVYQDLPLSIRKELAGRQARLSAWVRAEAGEQTGFLWISDSHQTHQTQFTADSEWALQVLETVIPTDTQKLGVQLRVHGAESVLYFDDVRLTEGNSSNLLLNGPGEASQWDLKPSVYHFMNDVLHLPVSPQFFGSLLDWRRSVTFRQEYWAEFWILLTNFWASLGVRQVNPAPVWQWALALLGLVAAAGLVSWIGRECRGHGDMAVWQKQTLGFFMIAAALSIVLPFARMHPLPTSYYPHGRYIYIAIVPIITLLIFGWREWAVVRFKIAHHTWLLAGGVAVGCLFEAMMLFDYALPYFYGPI